MIDSNILFLYIKRDGIVIDELTKIGFDNLAISTTTVCEAYYGMFHREKRQTIDIIKKFKKFHIDKEISIKTESLILEYFGGGLSMPDALIAATTLCNSLKLFTLNKKDFDFIKGIDFYKPTQKIIP